MEQGLWLSVERLVISLLLVVMFSNVIYGTPRNGVIIKGTTLAPNFQRKESQMAIRCPPSHPWSFGNGLQCCETFKAVSFDRNIDFYDPQSECPPEVEAIPCPDQERKCRSAVNPMECPPSHPQAVQQGCCATQGAIFEPILHPECVELLRDDSPKHCCRSVDFLGLEDCLKFRQKCRSNENKSVLEPVVLAEVSRPSFPAIRSLKDSNCDDLNNGLWAGPTSEEGWFIFDLQYHKRIHRVLLRNAHNGEYHDRSTQDYSVLVSNISEPYNWVEIASGKLLKPPAGSSCSVPLVTTQLPGNGIIARYAQFRAITYYGYGSVLNYVGLK